MANIFCFLAFLLLISQGSTQKCKEKFSGDNGQCDAYYECNEEGSVEKRMCPDGLVFKENAGYPCAYPVEVDCKGRSRQPAQRTADCPNQYTLYNKNCKEYVSCVEGVPNTMKCPEGLAFNDEKLICDWPDNVPGCGDINDFRCPKGSDPDLRYGDDQDCRKFYVCIGGVARLHGCSIGTVFNEGTGSCDAPENVPKCSNYYPKEVLDAITRLRSFDSSLI